MCGKCSKLWIEDFPLESLDWMKCQRVMNQRMDAKKEKLSPET